MIWCYQNGTWDDLWGTGCDGDIEKKSDSNQFLIGYESIDKWNVHVWEQRMTVNWWSRGEDWEYWLSTGARGMLQSHTQSRV